MPGGARDPGTPGTGVCQGPECARDPSVPGTRACQGPAVRMPGALEEPRESADAWSA